MEDRRRIGRKRLKNIDNAKTGAQNWSVSGVRDLPTCTTPYNDDNDSMKYKIQLFRIHCFSFQTFLALSNGTNQKVVNQKRCRSHVNKLYIYDQFRPVRKLYII